MNDRAIPYTITLKRFNITHLPFIPSFDPASGYAFLQACRYYKRHKQNKITYLHLMYIYSVGYATLNYKLPAFKTRYMTDYQLVQSHHVNKVFRLLIAKGLLSVVYNDKDQRIGYALTPAGWIHFNAFNDFLIRFHNIYQVSDQRARDAQAKHRIIKK